jgi:rhamnosyltransferase
MDTFASVVVTYQPCFEDHRNLLKLAGQSDFLVIIDNSGSSFLPLLESDSKVKIIKKNKNIGLAAALNEGIETAGQSGFDNIFLFDQDTYVSHNFFYQMIAFRKALKDSSCGFYVPNFEDRNSKTFASFPILKKLTFRHLKCPNIDIISDSGALIAITSGTLISYLTYKCIGPLKENYFIDFIDNEYCLRAALKGFFVAVNCEAKINHSIGFRTVKNFLGMCIKPNNHSPTRRYYIARNGVRTAIDYFNPFYSYLFLILIRYTHELLSIILYENNKLRKTRAFIIGCYDGLFKNMGESRRSL